MKKALQISLFSTLLLLFYFSLNSNNIVKSDVYIYSNKQKSSDDEKIKSIDASHFSFSTRNSNTFQLAKNNANSFLKTFSNAVFTTHSKTIENLFKVVYQNYTLHSKNSLFRVLQTEILFPFHYYW